MTTDRLAARTARVPPPTKHQLALMIWVAVFPTLTVLNLALRDLSVGGLSALTPTPLRVGERVAVFFPLQSAQRGWDASGRVLRCEPAALGYRVAVEFDDLPMAA